MTRTITTLAFLAPFTLLACAPSDDGPTEGEGEGGEEGEGEGDACALPPLARSLLEQTTSELFTAVAFTTSGTHGPEFIDLAFTQDLVGRNVFVGQHASFFLPCTEPTDYAPTCESAVAPEPSTDPFFADHDRCFRLGCIAADVPYVDTYFTMKPRTDAGDRHPFTTDTVEPGGTSTYADNPLVRWVVDLTTAVSVHADIDVAHTFTPTNGDALDASVTGVVTGTNVADEITLDLALTFPALADAVVTVDVHANPAGALSGAVTRAGVELATFGGTVDLAAPLAFAWLDACAP
jgi:hypothetical protein